MRSPHAIRRFPMVSAEMEKILPYYIDIVSHVPGGHSRRRPCWKHRTIPGIEFFGTSLHQEECSQKYHPNHQTISRIGCVARRSIPSCERRGLHTCRPHVLTHRRPLESVA